MDNTDMDPFVRYYTSASKKYASLGPSSFQVSRLTFIWYCPGTILNRRWEASMDWPLYELETDASIPSINLFGNLDISDVAQIRIQERPEDKCAILTLIKDNGDVFEIDVYGVRDLPIYAGNVLGRVLPLHRYVPVME